MLGLVALLHMRQDLEVKVVCLVLFDQLVR